MSEWKNRIYFADNLDILRQTAGESVDLIYIDPPFNTGRVQARTRIQVRPDEDGDRTGFQGKRYATIKVGSQAYADIFDDSLGFLEPRLLMKRVITYNHY